MVNSALSEMEASLGGIADRPDAVALVSPTGSVVFEHVWFRHPPGTLTSLPSLQEVGATDALHYAEEGGILRVDATTKLAAEASDRETARS